MIRHLNKDFRQGWKQQNLSSFLQTAKVLHSLYTHSALLHGQQRKRKKESYNVLDILHFANRRRAPSPVYRKETKSPYPTSGQHENYHGENFWGEMKVISELLLQLYRTLTFISHDSCPQETQPLRNWIQSSWSFSKPASYQLPSEAPPSLRRSKVRGRHRESSVRRQPTLRARTRVNPEPEP